MGLVDYSESESSGSESGMPAKVTARAGQLGVSRKPFQKVVDRSKPGKVVVSLPHAATDSSKDTSCNEPPAKRARTAGATLFSGFNSFLPAPKNASQAPPKPAASRSGLGVHLKTSAAPGFSRGEEVAEDDQVSAGKGLGLPPPKRQAEPSIPEGQKPEEEVKLVGKPLMFRPLSVARNSSKKKSSKPGMVKVAATKPTTKPNGATEALPPSAAAHAPKRVSLFSMHTEEVPEPRESSMSNVAYEPLFETGPPPDDSPSDYVQPANQGLQSLAPTTAPGAETVDSIANDLNLSVAARRELFGRGGGNQKAKQVINFNLDQEYRHNEAVRASGDQQVHNPVRAIQGGKHSLRQLVQNVHNQREALEDSFAQGKSNRKQASSRYGW